MERGSAALPWFSPKSFSRRSITIELVLLMLLLGAWWGSAPMGLGANDWNGLLVAVAPLAIAAMAQTLPIVAGGQGLSAGANLVFVSAFVAPMPMASQADAMTAVAIGVLMGLAIGLLNGVLIGLCGMRSAPVTFAVGAGSMALALQKASQAAIPAPVPLQDLLFAWQAWNVSLLPPILLAVICIAGEIVLRSTTGEKLRALGASGGAHGGGTPVILAYAIAGAAAGVGGILMAGSLGSIDPEMGAPVLLQILAAIALGGGIPGQSRGSFIGSLIGAFIVVCTGNLLIPFGVPDYASTALDAAWLFLALALCLPVRRIRYLVPENAAEAFDGRHWSAKAVLFIPLVMLLFNFHAQASDLATLIAGVATLAIGQAVVLRHGSIDLSMPAVISASAIATVALSGGSNVALVWVLPCIVLTAVAMGVAHAWVFVRLERGAIAATLASAGIAQALAAAMLVELPTGYAPSLVYAVVSERILGLSPAAWAMMAIGIGGTLLIDKNRDNRHRVLAGYLISVLSASLFGVVVAGLGGTVRYGILDTYLLPAVAAALVGTNLSTMMGRNSIALVIPAAILLVLIDIVLIGWNANYASRIGTTALIILLAEWFRTQMRKTG